MDVWWFSSWGVLTNHKKFGEALAILAGDALFLDPYALIAQADLPNEIKVDLIASLSLSSGSMGMVAGQVLDMEGEGKHLNLEELQTIHANKTGKLLAFPFSSGRELLQNWMKIFKNSWKQLESWLGLLFKWEMISLMLLLVLRKLVNTTKRFASWEINLSCFVRIGWGKSFFVTELWIRLMKN